MDNSTPQAGDILADEICAPNCELTSSTGSFVGAEAIRRSRDKAWTFVKTRKHWIDKVYTSNSEASDLLCFGRIHMGLANGKDVDSEFACRFKIKNPSDSDPRVEYFTVWADSAPLTKPLQA
ncbi:hypothetical protein B0A52_06750 [Exophiala mesophila]|uniref:Uncharacterized protein n=1 Tax=Exophiala mesophila TaxID=212818 RepID=A0A438N005_EXOME|nr:hypothetical protein B0A52_06750 [Exophiala mesophila]